MPATSTPAARVLGRMLVDEGRIDEPDLRKALDAQRHSGERVGTLLVRSGVLDAEELASTLARQLGIEHAPAPLAPHRDAARLLPETAARRMRALPLVGRGRTLRLGMADPLDVRAADDVRFRTGRPVEPVAVSASALDAAFERVYGGEIERLAEGLAVDDDPDDRAALERAARATPVVRLVRRILEEAVQRGASDLHWEPGDDGMAVRSRVDGVLRTVHRLPAGARSAVISRLKIMAGMDIAVRRRPQDGGLTLRCGQRTLSLRVSTLPARGGEKAVVRVLDPERAPRGLDDLGLAPRDLARLRRLVAAGQGVVLAAGPTGSGKSSTLQAALREIDRGRRNVVTLEDPVEYRLDGVAHVQVDPRAGLTFPAALRAVLRQDPDVIMVGEIRDRETAEIAMSAAVTGHLVLSTVHTGDAPGAVARLLHMGVPAHLVAGGLTGVVAQRLVRTLCRRCGGAGGSACPRCTDGFDGRTGVFQVMVVDEPMRDAVIAGASPGTLRRLGRLAGMGTLADDARRKLAEGLTDPHEAARVLRSDPGTGLACRVCRAPLTGGAPACPSCGAMNRAVCPCGHELEDGWRYCPWCVRPAPRMSLAVRENPRA